ncbi:MAG TPA: hypothetical protein VMB21_04740 [Candidatus Limnocylindria bacterium]|jgi:hypothetical protein|nr:hypothetical protein [Candidatus Limnocylindria bacterium]HTL67232.1 hypothetical protein [Lacunisphaera sp.]
MSIKTTRPTRSSSQPSSRALALDRDRKRRERQARRRAQLVEIRLLATAAQRDRLFALLDRESLADLRSPKKLLAAVKSGSESSPVAPSPVADKPKRAKKNPDASLAQGRAAQKPVAKAAAITGVQLDLFPL